MIAEYFGAEKTFDIEFDLLFTPPTFPTFVLAIVPA